MINIDPDAGWPQGRQPDLGRALQYLLLDRPGVADRRGDQAMQILPFADRRALNVYRLFERGIYRAHKAGLSASGRCLESCFLLGGLFRWASSQAPLLPLPRILIARA